MGTNHNTSQNHLTTTKFAGFKQRNTICKFFNILVCFELQGRLGLVESGQNGLVGLVQDSFVESGQYSLAVSGQDSLVGSGQYSLAVSGQDSLDGSGQDSLNGSGQDKFGCVGSG